MNIFDIKPPLLFGFPYIISETLTRKAFATNLIVDSFFACLTRYHAACGETNPILTAKTSRVIPLSFKIRLILWVFIFMASYLNDSKLKVKRNL